MKYRTKRIITRAIVTVLFIMVLSYHVYKRIPQSVKRLRLDDPTCYSIITDGTRVKYVFLITELLKAQGVNENDIYIIHDGGTNKHVFMDNFNYHTFPKMGSLTDVYKRAFGEIFKHCTYSVILEDDIFPGADAVSYFEWGRRVMENDESVLSVSGSHDNAVGKMALNPQVFVKAEQLLGLGWLTSNNFYDKVFSRIDTGIKTPWDKQVNDMMNSMSYISVFPHLPRTLHVPWSDGRNGHLLNLQLSINPTYRQNYVPVDIFRDYTGAYIEWLVQNFQVERKRVRNYAHIKGYMRGKVEWPFSFLANRPFGYHNGVTIYPSDDNGGKIIIIYKSN
jgi:hypothetical protein